jgi:hypothetical protein
MNDEVIEGKLKPMISPTRMRVGEMYYTLVPLTSSFFCSLFIGSSVPPLQSP